MTEQLAIAEVETISTESTAAAPKPLTPRQQLAWDYVRSHDGVTTDEVGAYLHAHKEKRPHSVDERCDFCAKDGRGVLTSKAVAPLVTYRRAPGGNLYIARNPADRVTDATVTADTREVACVHEIVHGTPCPTDPFWGI